MPFLKCLRNMAKSPLSLLKNLETILETKKKPFSFEAKQLGN